MPFRLQNYYSPVENKAGIYSGGAKLAMLAVVCRAPQAICRLVLASSSVARSSFSRVDLLHCFAVTGFHSNGWKMDLSWTIIFSILMASVVSFCKRGSLGAWRVKLHHHQWFPDRFVRLWQRPYVLSNVDPLSCCSSLHESIWLFLFAGLLPCCRFIPSQDSIRLIWLCLQMVLLAIRSFKEQFDFRGVWFCVHFFLLLQWAHPFLSWILYCFFKFLCTFFEGLVVSFNKVVRHHDTEVIPFIPG